MNATQLLVMWLICDLGACAAHILWRPDIRDKDERCTVYTDGR